MLKVTKLIFNANEKRYFTPYAAELKSVRHKSVSAL